MMIKDEVTITRNEWNFIRATMNQVASNKGEDCIGAVMICGGHRFMTNSEVCDFAKKLDATREECDKWLIREACNCVVTEDKLHPINRREA